MDNSIAFALFVYVTCNVVYSASTWEDLLQDHDGFDNAMSITVPLESAQDGYKHNILIGSDSQRFDVMITMSSSMLWVPKAGCRGVGSRKTYSPSPSFVPDGRNWTQKSYGGTINGQLGTDLVTIRGSASQQLQPKCTFGMATTISGEVKLSTDGVLGLARITDSTTPSQPFITQIKDLLSSHMFTIFLSQPSGSKAGSVTYGSKNSVNCLATGLTLQSFTDSYQFKNLTQPFQTSYISSDSPWNADLKYMFLLSAERLSEGFVSVQMCDLSKITDVLLGNFTHRMIYTAMPELIPLITGPAYDIEGIAKAANAKYKDGSYEITCNATIPNLEIKAGSAIYSLQSNKLIVKSGSRCILAIASQTGGGFGTQWRFGAPLFQQYCVTFNLMTNNLEFLSVKNGPTTGSSTRRITTTSKRNTTSTAKTTRRTPTTTPKKITTSSPKTTRRISTTPKRNITTSPTKTTRRLPTTTPKKVSTSTRKTTRRIPTTTPRKNSTSTRRTTRRISTTSKKITTSSKPRTTRRFTTTTVRTTTKKLASTTYLYRLFSFMLFSVFFI